MGLKGGDWKRGLNTEAENGLKLGGCDGTETRADRMELKLERWDGPKIVWL